MSMPPTQAAPSVEALVGRIADEFTQRLDRGEHPSIEEYAAANPAIAGVLREALQALELLRLPDLQTAITEGDPFLTAPLGDFRLVRRIGGGGMGVVYEARQISLNRSVAVKILPLAAALDPRQLQRFKKESEAAANLKHEHVVPVYVVGYERGVHFYAMQFIEGLSLAAVVGEMRRLAGMEQAEPEATAPYLPDASNAGTDTLPLATLATEGSTRSPEYFRIIGRLGLEAAEGLEHAHQMDVLHRDIKPANLLVDQRGSLWITDFGLAQMRSDARLTRTGELIGTVRYMSPEQALAKRVVVDHRTDIYSLGATLYELATLEPVFKGADRQELLRQIAFDDPTPPRRLNKRIPRDLETIISSAMAKAPARRYPSAREMAEDLRLFLSGQPIKARPEGLLRWLGRRLRRQVASLLLALAAFISLVVLAFMLLSTKQPSPLGTQLSPEEKEVKRREEALAALNHDLGLGKKVTLIGEVGRPAYFRWRTDDTHGNIAQPLDGPFEVMHLEYGLVELLPDPRQERYRFSAEVRHERESIHEGRVGVYFAHSEIPAGNTNAHFYCAVDFNDLIDQGANGRNIVRLEAQRQPPKGLENNTAIVEETEAEFTPAKVIGAPGPWRTIEVEVRPESITIFWEGICIGRTPRATLMMSARPLLNKPPQPLATNPEFPPRGGLGLFVTKAVASFRNVTLEPID